MPHHLIDALIGAAAALALPATAAGIAHHAYMARDIAETVEIRTVVLEFPAPGEFLVKGVPAASPIEAVKVSAFRIMKQQVGAAAYALCVKDGACDPADPAVKARGFYGANANGIEDFGGNVWEWTSTCYARTAFAPDGSVESRTDNCGVRVLEGLHRAYMSSFVRDGKSGGCAVGTPPEHLGFRLVRDDTPLAHAKLATARLWERAAGS